MEELDEFGIPIKKTAKPSSAVDEFGIPIKKKDSSTATATVTKSDSEPQNGSSGGKGFPKIDTNSVAPGLGVQPNYELEKAKQLAKSKRLKELEVSFYASTKDNTDDAVAEQRLQDRKVNKGFWNTAEDLTKKAYNTVIDAVSATSPNLMGLQGAKISEDPFEDEKKQALLEAKKNKITLTETQKNTRAEEIFKEKEKDNLFIDRANSYLDNLDVEDKNILEQSRADKAVHLQEENLKKFKVVSAMEMVGNEKIKEYQNIEKQLLALKEKNQSFPQDLYDKYIGLSGEIKQIGGNIQKYSDQIQKNKSDLGTIEQEFDLFKRGYGDMDNFIGNAIATTGELANGIFGAVNYVSSLSPDPITRLNSMRGQEVANKISGKLDEYRGALRKPVESIESAEGFVNYASDLVANQLPILAVTSTGAVGLAALGTSTTGQTFTKINQDVLNGKENYSPLQMASIPLLQGGFEVISEIPTLSILKKGSRVISAAANGEIDLIKKSGGEVFKNYIKDFGKEFGGEHITNLGQNFNARYVQGKEDVGLLDNTGRVSKDTAFLTTLLQGSPHVFGAVAKVFQSNQDLGTLDENSRKIIDFSKQLNTEGLSDTEKTVIQKQIDKVTAKSSKIIASTIGKIGDMPNVSYDEIISLNSQAGKIKAEAKEINNSKLPNKKELLTSLGEDYKTLQIKRSGLIDGSITPFDLLTGNEQAKRLTQASREITKRDNPDGTKEKFEVKPEDAKTLATENYLKELSNTENEQTPPTSETKPQAEVPQQAEAEKVAELRDSTKITQNQEVSPVEDVVAPSVEKPISLQEENVSMDNNLRKEKQLEIINNSNPAPNSHNTWVRTVDDIKTAKEVFETAFNDGEMYPDFTVDDMKESLDSGEVTIYSSRPIKNGSFVTPSRMNAEEYAGGQGSKIYSKTIKIDDVAWIDESEGQYAPIKETKNAKPSKANTPTNGNVPLGASNVGESGNAKPKSNSKSSVPSSVDGGEVKGEVEISPFAEFEKVVNESKSVDEAFDKVKNIQGVSSETSKSFREKYDPKGELSTKEAFTKFYDEVKGIANAEKLLKPQVNPKKVEKPSLQTDADAPTIGVDKVDKTDYEIEPYYKLHPKLSKEDLDNFDYISDAVMTGDYEFLPDGYSIKTMKSYRENARNYVEVEVTNPKGDKFYIRENTFDLRDENFTVTTKAKSVETAQVENKPKPTTKERIAEKIKLSDAKIDENSEIVKAKLKAFTDMFPSADINPDDYHTNGFSTDAIIDMVAKAAKAIAKGGIVTSEHIKQAIAGYNTIFDDEIDPKLVEEKINPKVEDEKKSEPKKSKSKESSKDMEDFRDSWNKDPNPSGEINQYDSGNTIKREHGELRNNQDYEVQKDLSRVQIGIKAIEHAKRLFGAEYVEKTLSFIEQANLSPEKKAVAYVLLENEMDARVKDFPDNVGVKKLQDLVRAKSQAFLANSARAIGAGRFRVERFRELVKNGFAEEEYTNAILSTKQIKDKEKIQQLSQVTSEDVDNESDLQEQKNENERVENDKEAIYTQEDFDRELQKAKDELGNDYNISVFENLKRQAKKDKLSDKKEDLKEAKAKVLEDIRKVVRESMRQTSVNPFAKPLEFAALVTKLAKLHIQDGALSLEEVANNIYNDLKDMSKDISKESIFNILKSKPKKVMSEATKRKIYITLLNKNIESLDTQIDAKKRDVINRVDKYKNDAEINDLRDKRTEKRDELAKVDPSYAESRKLATDLKTAQKSLDEYQRRINENELSPKENQPKSVNAKLKKLRDARDSKRKEFLAKKKKFDDSLKPAVIPPTKEELADKKYLSDVKKKINSLNQRIEDLKANKPKSNDGKSTAWNEDISKLEKELGALREAKKVVKQKSTEKQTLSDYEITARRIARKIEQREKVLADLIAGKKKDVNGKNSDWSAEISKVNSEIESLRKLQKNKNKDSQAVKDLVKKSLIEAGFSKEITVNTKNGKVQKQVLDWKKLAGEAGTIDNIRKNVEEALKSGNYSPFEIEAMKDALEAEYDRLSTDVIQKGLDELIRRNTPSKPVDTKTAARKLAELHNYGLFEKNKDSYEKIINNVLGFNELDQKAFDEMKQIAKGYAVLMDSGLSETEMKDAINTLSRRQSRLVATLAFSQADWKFKLAVALSEITNLSTRFKLVNLGNLAENISSGMMARAANNMMDAIANGINGKKTSNKAIITQSKINARAKLKGITLETAESYGDTSSLLLNHSAVEDYFNNSTANKAWHAVISTYMAKPVLEGADSYNKILITEAKMVRAAIKVLEAKGMSNSEALDYVANAITGESMKEALVKAKALIEKVNKDVGRKLLNDSESSIKSLASDIVKESLVSGGQLSETELKAIYNAAYKSAGKDIGHVSNNWVTDQISSKGAQVEKQVADAIKEKNWGVASGAVVNQIIWKNFISTFVGGGTNWFVKGLQKSANPLSLISLRDDMMKLKMAGKLDVTTDEGIKNMEESLYRGMNLRSTSATMLMGAIITASIIGGMSASGADDEIAKWLKKNQWAKKFFDKMVPDAVVLMLAINDKDFGRYIAKMVNVKADFFDDQKNTYKILEKYAKGYVENDQVKISKASGDLGAMIGKRFELPAPLRAAKDIKQIYKGVVKGEYDETNYYTSGFLNGLFQGGIIEMWGLRKDPDFQEQTKGAFSTPKIKLPSLKFNANPQ